MNVYIAIEDELAIYNQNGVEVYRGRPEGYEVSWATSIPQTEDGLVLYQPYPSKRDNYVRGAFQNLVRVSPQGFKSVPA